MNFMNIVEPLKTDTLRDRLKYTSWRGVRLIEVLENTVMQLDEAVSLELEKLP